MDRCIAAGADPAARSKGDWTPLHRAATRGTPETVAALLAAGANPKTWDAGGRLPADLAEDNPAVRNYGIFWTLNEARFE